MKELTITLTVAKIKTVKEIIEDLKLNGFDTKRKIFSVIDTGDNTMTFSQLERQNHRSLCGRK